MGRSQENRRAHGGELVEDRHGEMVVPGWRNEFERPRMNLFPGPEVSGVVCHHSLCLRLRASDVW